MIRHPFNSFWIPLALAGATLFASYDMTNSLSPVAITTCRASAALLVIVAGVLAYRARSLGRRLRGGTGGHATVVGDGSQALGGRGGDAQSGLGGSGGNAVVRGNDSIARGGDGGSS